MRGTDVDHRCTFKKGIKRRTGARPKMAGPEKTGAPWGSKNRGQGAKRAPSLRKTRDVKGWNRTGVRGKNRPRGPRGDVRGIPVILLPLAKSGNDVKTVMEPSKKKGGEGLYRGRLE